MNPAAAVALPKPETPASVTLPVVPRPLENRVWVLLSGIAAILSAIAYAVWKRRRSFAQNPKPHPQITLINTDKH
jgi:hypothetical protein